LSNDADIPEVLEANARNRRAEFLHQPDFNRVIIYNLPENNRTSDPIILSAPCVCGRTDAGHDWSIITNPGGWRQANPVISNKRI
jgi:hypothetical protein